MPLSFIIGTAILKYEECRAGRVFEEVDANVSGSTVQCVGNVSEVANASANDMYISGSKQSVQVFIFTKKVQEMADAIAFDMKRGVTVLPAKGWYSKEDKEVIMVVTRKSDLNLLLRYVKSIDFEAFLSVSSVMGVYGQGFDTIKVKTKK